MLQTIGPVLYHTVNTSLDMKYVHIRACVLRNDLDNLPDTVIVDLPWGGHITQEIKYTMLPDTCFKCKQIGHRAADCPSAVPATPRTRNYSTAHTAMQRNHQPQRPQPQTLNQVALFHKSPKHTWKRKWGEKVAAQCKSAGTTGTAISAGTNQALPSPTQPIHATDTHPSKGTSPVTIPQSPTDQHTPLNRQLVLLGGPEGSLNPQRSTLSPCEDEISPQSLTKIVAQKRILPGGKTSPHEEEAQPRYCGARITNMPLLPWKDTETNSTVQEGEVLTQILDGNSSEEEDSKDPETNDIGELKVQDRVKLEASLAAILPGAHMEVDYTVALSHLTKSVTQQQDRQINTKPPEEEIDKVANLMKNDKSPGLDGFTTEMLLACWPFIRGDCIAMIHHFWDQGELLRDTRTAVIKLIPKTEIKELLKNWRPLSLMTLSYKLIAKIMAERLKKFLPQLVDPQQTGFIHGRSITNNLLTLQLGTDWARISNQKCMFIKLDFVKAYDRIEHGFLLATLEALGFSEESVSLFKGLTTRGMAKVHINQDFTERFSMQRGVRQGCPLAPYLFTLCTQVMMDMLNAKLRQGTIQGLKTGDGQTILHQLFADDTGLFLEMNRQSFSTTMETLKLFEKASGAKLNLTKTLVLPLGSDPPPQWLIDSQCQLAGPADRFRYLGILAGTDVLEREVLNDIKIKYERRLNHWSSRLLTWPERLILAQGILRTLPNYTLMAIGLSQNGITMLERITAEFLWGTTREGKKRRLLIAWKIFARRRKDGGLGWPDMNLMAQAFLLKNIGKILQGNNEDWVRLAAAIIKARITETAHPNEIKQWDHTTILLGLKALRIPNSSILDRMLKCWFKMKRRLTWQPDRGPFPESDTP
ncbi:hypothetical protein R1sor_012177 [Riccia sorocarpa]|uniref:CCHC-type domain-containing protein n=1 Tax=Riccia sorocarpa TaxID=122646 RepID=A0ABD3I4A3_9MARC